MFCIKCGKKNQDGMKFCMFCGAPLQQSTSADTEDAADDTEFYDNEITETEYDTEENDYTDNGNDNSRKKVYIFAVIMSIITLVLVVLLVGMICLYISNNSGNDKEISAEAETSTEEITETTSEAETSTEEDIVIEEVPLPDDEPQEAYSSSDEIIPFERNRDFVFASSSSQLKNQGNYTYTPYNVLDGDIKTAWCEGAQGTGENSWLMVSSSYMEYIRVIGICNGYRENSKTYEENGKVVSALLEFSDGTSQTIYFDNEASDGFSYFEVGGVNTSYVKITLLSCIKGSKYSDTCISEVAIY